MGAIKETNLTGSGVYGWKGGSEVHKKIKPSKPGPVHTINRAELIAILFALDHWCEQEDLVIATDSACAMQAIKEHLQNPEAHRYHKHKRLFQAISNKILPHARDSQHTSWVKVKSHIGIRGNELADALAVAATKEWDIDFSEHHTAPLDDMIWVTKLLYGEVNGAPILADLQDSLRKAIHGKQHLGQANQDTIYFQAWKGT